MGSNSRSASQVGDGWLVLTTINPPNAAIKALARSRARGLRLVVVGDEKTPEDWSVDGVHYLSLANQRDMFGALADMIPVGHYSRKNLGYLYAISRGAEFILETDDDNYPYQGFGSGLVREVKGRLVESTGWINAYRYFTEQHIWPRGLPLDEILSTGSITRRTEARCVMQQFLADADPDVDAVYRLVIGKECYFRKDAEPLILSRGTLTPLNSQNTLFFREAFPLLYLPSLVSFRMTDIWRSLVAQHSLWAHGHQVAVQPPTVRQYRNPHDLMDDFRQELEGYMSNKAIAKELGETLESMSSEDTRSMEASARLLWGRLVVIGILPRAEERILETWLITLSEHMATSRKT